MIRPSFIAACLLTFTALIGCATGPNAADSGANFNSSAGSLIIAGGGTERDNAAIWGRFIKLAAGRKIGIAATASGVADEAAANCREALLLHGATPEQVIELPLRQGDTASADSPATVALIDGLGAVWFTGGDQSRITATLMSAGADRPALTAMRNLIGKRKGVIGGTSAGAAMMSEMMLANGTSDRWLTTLLNDPKAELPLERGIGFAPNFVTDQHFFARGRTGRLAAALTSGDIKTGIGIDENRAVLVDLATQTVEGIGNQAALVLYAGDTAAKAGTVGPLTAWLLGDGDTVLFTPTIPVVTPATGSRVYFDAASPGTPRPRQTAVKPRPAGAATGPFDKEVIPDLLISSMYRPMSEPAVAADTKWKLTVARDASTLLVGEGPAMRIFGVRLTISRVGTPAVQR